jgi:hypothetical protein
MISTVTLFNSLSSLAPTAAAERGPSVALVERFSGSLGLTDPHNVHPRRAALGLLAAFRLLIGED